MNSLIPNHSLSSYYRLSNLPASIVNSTVVKVLALEYLPFWVLVGARIGLSKYKYKLSINKRILTKNVKERHFKSFINKK